MLSQSTHEVMLRMFARSRIYLGVSVSDGISTSMLEAMALGAFPIQTDTSCCDEWIRDGLGGFRIPADDVVAIAERIRRAATDDGLVNRAAELNWETVRTRLDQKELQQKAIGLYRSILGTEGR